MNSQATYQKNQVHTPGVRLRNARAQLGLSQQAVAKRLCLKVSMVRDIEEDKAPSDLALTFLRGYIRSYAKLVDIPEDELLSMLERQTSVKVIKVAPIRSFPLLRKDRKKPDSWLATFTWLLLFIVIGLKGPGWWKSYKAQKEESTAMDNQFSSKLYNRINNRAQSAQINTNDTPSTTNEGQISINNISSAVKFPRFLDPTNTVPIPAPTKITGENDAIIFSSQASPVYIKPTMLDDVISSEQLLPIYRDSAALSHSNSNVLAMSFTADCWLEVTDITGKKLFSGLQHRGDRLNLKGQAPYKLKVGAPAAVEIQFQGKFIDLSHFIRSKQIARFTINAEQLAGQ